MWKKIKPIIIMILSFVFFVVMVGLIILADSAAKQTESTTEQYVATVQRIEITDTGKKKTAKIFLKEYETPLCILSNITDNIDIEGIKDLQEDQIVIFRVERIKAEALTDKDAPFVDIVSLETESKPIFTLADYNAFMKTSAFPAKITGAVVALVFLSVSVFSFFKIRKR